MGKSKTRKLTSVFTAAIMLVTAILSSVSAIGVSAEEIPEGYTPIYNIEELYGVRNNPEENYILMNDIDMTEDTSHCGNWSISDAGWSPIGSILYFRGIFDGNGHAIIGMNIYGEIRYNYIGLFGCNVGTIKNLKMLDVNINIICDNEAEIGSIAGKNIGIIENCFSTGEIKSENNNESNYTGGIVGYNQNTIENCYNSANIKANNGYIGGICGYDEVNHIRYCYNTGNIVSESINKGAIFGYSYGNEISCYYLNGSCEGNKNISSECIGLSVAQMKSASAFTDWDFNNVWLIDNTSSYRYPQLKNCMQIPVTAISLSTMPDKNIYTKGDKLNPAGGKISVYHEADETTGEVSISENMLGKYNMEQVGKQNISVTYIDKFTEFEIIVNPYPIENLKIYAVTENSASLLWNKQSGISGYYIYKRSSENEEWRECGKVKDVGFIDEDENINTEFTYAVSSYLTIDGVDYISEKNIVKKPLDFRTAEIRVDDVYYDGNKHSIDPEVIYNGKTLIEGVDYDVVAGDYEVEFPGEYSITLNGKNDYAGTVIVEFKVICRHKSEHGTWGKCEKCGYISKTVDISNVYVENYNMAPAFADEEDYDNIKIDYFYDTIALITYDGYDLKRDIDYTIPEDKIIRENRFGKCTFTIEGIGCFKGEIEVTCIINCVHGYLFDHKTETICKFCGACNGDISGNNKVDLYDAIAIAQSLIGTKEFTPEEYYIADFNRDGKVDLYDAIAIAKYLLKHN